MGDKVWFVNEKNAGQKTGKKRLTIEGPEQETESGPGRDNNDRPIGKERQRRTGYFLNLLTNKIDSPAKKRGFNRIEVIISLLVLDGGLQVDGFVKGGRFQDGKPKSQHQPEIEKEKDEKVTIFHSLNI